MKIRVCSWLSWLEIQQPSKDWRIVAAPAPLQAYSTQHLTAIAQYAARPGLWSQNNANITSRSIEWSRNTTRNTSRAPLPLISTHRTLYTNAFPTKLGWGEFSVQGRLLLFSPILLHWSRTHFKRSGLFWLWQECLGGVLGKVRPFLGSMLWQSSWRDLVVLQHKKMRWIIWQEYYGSFLRATEESPFLTHLVTGYWIFSPESRPWCQARCQLSLLHLPTWLLRNALSCLVLLKVISPQWYRISW